MALKYVKGLDKLKINLEAIKAKKIIQITKAVEMTAVDILNSAQRNHGENAHSNLRYKNRTVRLTRSFRITKTKVKPRSIKTAVYTGTKYAPHVEYGTIKTRAFPFLRPALDGVSYVYQLRIKKAML